MRSPRGTSLWVVVWALISAPDFVGRRSDCRRAGAFFAARSVQDPAIVPPPVTPRGAVKIDILSN